MNSREFISAQHKSSNPRRKSGCDCTYLTARSCSKGVGVRENAARYNSVTASCGIVFRSTNLATRPFGELIFRSISGDIDKCSTCGKFALLLRAHSHAELRGGRSNTSRKYEPNPSCGKSTERGVRDLLLNTVRVSVT